MPIQYSKLGGNTAKFPYLVGITTAPGRFGTGILISTKFILTSGHVVDESTSVNVISQRGPTSACVRKTDDSLDLALLELAEPISADRAKFADLHLHPETVLLAAGVQEMPGKPELLAVAEVELKYRNKNDVDGTILDIQFEGGARPGYSGGPVVAEQGGSLVCVGLIRCGGNWAASSNAIGLGSIRAFVADDLPTGLEPPESAKEKANRGILLRWVLIATTIGFIAVAIGANAGWKYLAPNRRTITSGKEQQPLPPESSNDQSRPKSNTPSPPADASPATPGKPSAVQSPEEVFVSQYVVPDADHAVRGQRRWAVVISADRDGFPNLVSEVSSRISSDGASSVAIFRPSVTNADGFDQLFAGNPALNRKLGPYCDHIFVGKITSTLTRNTEYGILTLSLSLQAKLMSAQLGTVEAQFAISENGAGLTSEEAAANAEERLALKLKDRLATVIKR